MMLLVVVAGAVARRQPLPPELMPPFKPGTEFPPGFLGDMAGPQKVEDLELQWTRMAERWWPSTRPRAGRGVLTARAQG